MAEHLFGQPELGMDITTPSVQHKLEQQDGEMVVHIHIDQLCANRRQPRKHFNSQALQDLATSIAEKGVQSPIIVRRCNDGISSHFYEIVAGERRFRSSKIAGKDSIPAIIRDVDDNEAEALACIENMQREDLIFLDEMETVVSAFKRRGSSELAAMELGITRKTIDRYRKVHAAIHLNPEFSNFFDADAFHIKYTIAEDFAEIAPHLHRLRKGSLVEKKMYERLIQRINKAIDAADPKDKKGGVEKSLGALRSLFNLSTNKKKGATQQNSLYTETAKDILLNIRLKKDSVPPENTAEISDCIRRFLAAAGITL